jgi:hypothetical protein
MPANWVFLFAIVADVFAVLNEPMDYIKSVVLPVSIKIILVGILLSHLMKMLIQKLHVLQKARESADLLFLFNNGSNLRIIYCDF